MKRVFGITVCLFLFAAVNIAQKRSVKQTKSKSNVSLKAKKSQNNRTKPRGDCDLPASVHALFLDKTEVTLNCLITNENCSNNKIVEVITVATDTGQEKFVYKVSGGKIIGEGANVKWYLSGLKPGIYTITAAISQPTSDGKEYGIFGVSQTKVITIKE